MGVPSTFGGSALDRRLIDFETVPDDTGDAGGIEPAVEPAGGEAPAEEWSAPSQEDWQSMQQSQQELHEAIEYFASLMQPPAPPEPQGPEQVEIDPFADDFQQQLDRYIEAKTGRYEEFVQRQQVERGEELAKDILANIRAREGDFVFEGSAEKVRELSDGYWRQAVAANPNMSQQEAVKAAEASLEAAAKDVREWEAAVGKAYHEQQINQLSNLGGARREPPAGPDGTQQFTVTPGGDEVDLARRYGALTGR